MEIKQRVDRIVRRNVEWLQSYQVSEGPDRGAIEDPIRGDVIGDNYATEEFSLSCAYLLKYSNQNGLIKPLRRALKFHQRTTDGYPKGEHDEHYQHRRLGFTEAFIAGREFLQPDIEQSLLETIESWSPKRNSSNCNWHMMNSVLGQLVTELTGDRCHKSASRIDLLKTLTYWRPDGFFTDLSLIHI